MVGGAATGMLFRASCPFLPSKRVTTTTAAHIVEPYELLTKAVGDASPDLLRTLAQTTINMLLPADADAVIGGVLNTCHLNPFDRQLELEVTPQALLLTA